MTKHTDTSRIADLRFQVSEKMPINHSDLSCLFDRIEALEAERDRYKALVKEAGEGLAFYADDDRYEYDQTCCFDTRGISRKRVAEIHETGGDILFDRGDRARTTLAKIKDATDAD